MEYTDKHSLKLLLKSKREDEELVSKVESVQLVNQHEICNIVDKCTENVEHLRDLFVKHLSSEEIKEKNTSSFTITSLDKTNCTIVTRQKTISLGDIDLLHRVFPNLNSINLYMFNLRYDEEESIAEANADNTVSSIDMTFNTFPANMSKLVMYILKSYGKHLTTLKIKKGGNISSKDKKWEDLSQGIVNDGELLLKHNYQLSKLKSVEISHFYQRFPTAAFVEVLSKSNCALQHAAFIGVAQSDSIVMHLKKMAKESFKDLALDTYDFPKLQDLSTFPLESLFLRWADNTAIDINAALSALPQLRKLDLGYDMDYNQLKESKTQLKQNTPLQSLTLHHVIIDKDILDTVAVDLPPLSKLTLSNCKFGSSRVSVQEKITLLNYRLRELVLDNCALYFNKKDSIEKRHINKLNINIDSDRKYTAEIVSKVRASMAKYEHISNVENQFSYSCFSETAVRPTNTLTLTLKSIESIKLDTMGLKAVKFQSDGVSHSEPALAGVDNADYGELIENLIEESIAQEEAVVEKQVVEEVDEEIVEQQVIEEIDADAVMESLENEESAAVKESKEEENENDSEYQLLTESEIKRIKTLQEMDKDFAAATETDSSTTDESDIEEEGEEEGLARRRSMRVRQISASITMRELRKRKRVRYNSSDETSQESDSESEDDDKPVRSARKRKREREFIKSIKSTQPVIKVYPSKRLQGYYK
ncbi:uncharacterized protein ATC70_007037 [Mucor velutinosus]|uniref:Uncharacterized protein n=1 Tax=Mucor velutinosus TaxID=708070 RepID=A0AAN7HQ95_9FUNG|nr:hypothetical protein ATC70_007037 [Mucor velutinosus]